MNADDSKSATSDGRRQRSLQSRQRIIDAMMELIDEGVLEPTADQVSARAGVAIRTVFRHFNDMDSLYREISRRVHGRAQPIVDTEIEGGTPAETLHNLVERRVRLYEEMMPMRLAADAWRHRSLFLQEDHAQFVATARRILRDHCPAELRRDKARFEALDALLSYEFWLRLRRAQKLPPRTAAAVVHAALDAVLKDS